MPIRYALMDRVIHTVFEGRVTDDELLAYYGRPELQHHTGLWLEVVDARAVEHMAVTTQGQARLASLAAARPDVLRGGRVAMVATHDAAYGMFRMWEISREHLPYSVKVFRDFDAACAWLAAGKAP